MIKKLQNKVFSKFGTEFSRNIFKVFSGSSIAYLMGFISLPVLTRIYSADDFGNYQLLFSIIILFSSISSLKYEIAIVLPKEDDEADKVIAISLWATVFTTLLFGVVLYTASNPLLKLLDAMVLKDYIPYLILGIFFYGLYLALQYVFIRNKEYGILSKNRIFETFVNVLLSILLGFLSFGFAGLFYGKVVSLGSASGLIILKQKLIRLLKIKFRDFKSVAHKYIEHVYVNTPTVLINSFALELPVFMISSFFNLEIVGLFSLSRRILNLPINIISKSFAQVYYQSAAEIYNTDKHKLLDLYKDTIKKLALIGLIPGVLGVFAPQIFAVFFGSEWTQAGYYVRIMVPWVYLQFINNPIATTHNILNSQKLALVLVVISILLRFGAMYYFSETPEMMITALSVTSGLFYLFYILSVYFSIKRKIR